MTENERQIIATLAFIITQLSESDKSYLLGLGEGMRIKTEQAEQIKQEAALTV